jgi:hypothetical protein
MSEIIASGHCLCGNIQFQIEGEPVWSGYCHCESCRRITGSVVTSWIGIKDTDLVFTRGRPVKFEVAGIDRGFCSTCGSTLTYEANRFPNYIQVHIGALDNPNSIKPLAHVHFAEKIEWFDVEDQLPRFEGSAAAAGDDWKNI